MKISAIALLAVILLVHTSMAQAKTDWASGIFSVGGSGKSSSSSSSIFGSSLFSSSASSGSATKSGISISDNQPSNLWVQAVDQVLSKPQEESPSAQISKDNVGMDGAYHNLDNFQNNQGFKKADSHVRSQYKALANADVVSVDAQIVAGTNYRIVYQDEDRVWEVVVFVQSWTKTVKVLSFEQVSGPKPVKTISRSRPAPASSRKVAQVSAEPSVVIDNIPDVPATEDGAVSREPIKVGGYNPLTDFENSPIVQRIDALARQSYPELADAKILSVFSQVVSGFNYRVNYGTATNIYEVIAYHQSWTKTLKITSFRTVAEKISDIEPTPRLPPNEDAYLPPTTAALNVESQDQIDHGADAADSTVSDSGNHAADVTQTTTTSVKVPIVGGYSDVSSNDSDRADIKNADKLLRSTYPILNGAEITRVQTQVVAGINVKITYSVGDKTFEGVVNLRSWEKAIQIVSFKQTGGSEVIISRQSTDPETGITYTAEPIRVNAPPKAQADSSSADTTAPAPPAAPKFVSWTDTFKFPDSILKPLQQATPSASTEPQQVTTVATPPPIVESPKIIDQAPISQLQRIDVAPIQEDNPASKQTALFTTIRAFSSDQQVQQADAYARQQYPHELKGGIITKATRANTPDGAYYRVFYQGPAGMKYEATVVFISSTELKMLSFKNFQRAGSPSDTLCQVFDSAGACKACVWRSVFNAQKKCVEVNPQCNTFNNATGACTSCYGGYILNGGNCLVDKSEAGSGSALSGDANCRKADKGGKCQECSFRYILNAKGVCEQISDFCNTFDSTGTCTSCYKGYVLLKNGNCVVPEN